MNSALEDSREELIKLIHNLDLTLPQYLVKLLLYTGFDNILSISLMDESKISFLETFAKKELSEILEGDERKSFFGIYEKKINLFRILEGHKLLLKELIDRCKLECKEKNRQKRKQVEQNEVNVKNLEKRLCKNRNFNVASSDSVSNISDESASVEGVEVSNNPIVFDKTHIEYLSKTYIVNLLKKEAESLPLHVKKCFEELHKPVVEIKGDNFAEITCPCCKKNVRICSKSMKCGKKWILSNFNKHLKAHLTHRLVTSEDPVEHQAPSKKPIQTNIVCFMQRNVPKSNENSRINANRNPDEDEVELHQVESISTPTSSTMYSQKESTLNNSHSQEESIVFNNIVTPFAKWKDPKYSRSERNRRALEVIDISQPKITDFVTIINGIENILKNRTGESNSRLVSFEKLQNSDAEDSSIVIPNLAPSNIKGLLQNLKTTSEKNVKLNKHAHKFDEPLKLFSLYLYLVGGRLTYETLYANMNKSLPSITTLRRTLDESCTIKEGVLRLKDLKQYLLKRNLPLQVFISEDQTAIIKRVEYDSKSNAMIGFVLPLQDNGFPGNNKFVFSKVADAEEAFKNNNMASNAYVFMAQPLCDNVPAFCCAVYGTDNKFDHQSVLSRWNFIRSEAKKLDIEIIGYSSDGDNRCLKAMRILKKFYPDMTNESVGIRLEIENNGEEENPHSSYFVMEYNINEPIVIQDTVHIGTKLKTRLLKEKMNMLMGKFHVSIEHIKSLMTQMSKDQHCLASHYLEGSDKMNFEAIDKLSSTKVISLLNSITNGNATKQYLQLTRYILDAFLDKNLLVKRRIYNMWYCIFFIRFWKSWLIENHINIQKNFITSNTHVCIELNGHNLLLGIEKCKTKHAPELFLPWLFSSQPCEKTFRQLRSMTSTFSTVVNFSMKEILHRLHRVHALNEITSDLEGVYQFPREANRKLGYSPLGSQQTDILPDIAEIKTVIEKARADALASAEDLGMILKDPLKASTDSLVPSMHMDQTKKKVGGKTIREDLEKDILQTESPDDEEVQNDISLFNSFADLELKDYTKAKTVLTPDSPYVEVVLNNNHKKVVRKSAICWFFGNKCSRLSTDRVQRVRGMTDKSKKRGQTAKLKKTINTINKKTKPSRGDASDDETTDTDDVFSVRSDSLSLESEDLSDLETDKDKAINIKPEEYYAVYYDLHWYIGRVIKTDIAKSLIKFLTFDLDHYTWPKSDDIAEVENKYIFYGPFQLTGSCPFYLKRCDEIRINKKYKDIKKTGY